MRQFANFISNLVGKKGAGSLADEIRYDAGAFSRFRSGQGAISLEKIDEILELGGALIISKEEFKQIEDGYKEEIRRLKDALELQSDLWKEERRKNGGK